MRAAEHPLRRELDGRAGRGDASGDDDARVTTVVLVGRRDATAVPVKPRLTARESGRALPGAARSPAALAPRLRSTGIREVGGRVATCGGPRIERRVATCGRGRVDRPPHRTRYGRARHRRRCGGAHQGRRRRCRRRALTRSRRLLPIALAEGSAGERCPEGALPALVTQGARLRSAGRQATSKRPAAPMPPPMHIVTTTYFTPRRFPSMRACPTMRAPLMPYGCPIATAPPLTFSRSSGI